MTVPRSCGKSRQVAVMAAVILPATGEGAGRVLQWLLVSATGWALLLAIGCSAVGPHTDDAAVQVTEVFYGTDRNLRESETAARYYGEHRGSLSYGVAGVAGAAAPGSSRLATLDPMPEEQFLLRLQTAVSRSQEPTVLVFVHGFLRSFQRVSRLVAEFAVDTGFAGVPVMWSWPSTTNPARYTVDETSVMWARADFAWFLSNILEHSGATRIHLVSHSLGARAVTDVILSRLLPAGVDISRIGKLVLLAPDIDREIFERELGPELVAAGLDVTLYASANDKAMAVAKSVHGHQRAGDTSGGPVLLKGVETIDATPANRSILGHSYFEESRLVTSDLASLLNDQLPAARRRNLVPVSVDGMTYWRLGSTAAR